MTKRTFRTENGWVVDDHGNRASIAYWYGEERARASLETLNGCADCTNCSNCDDCSNCHDCTNCYDCTNCSNCHNCSDCTGCTNCIDCTGCIDCTDESGKVVFK